MTSPGITFKFINANKLSYKKKSEETHAMHAMRDNFISPSHGFDQITFILMFRLFTLGLVEVAAAAAAVAGRTSDNMQNIRYAAVPGIGIHSSRS